MQAIEGIRLPVLYYSILYAYYRKRILYQKGVIHIVNTQDIIIVVILAVILIPAVKTTITHMKGEGSCCGGPKEKVPKKKLPGKPKTVYTVGIEGMHCSNCKNRIEKHLNEIPDVIAKVNLSNNTAKVSVYEDTSKEIIKETIEKLDFTVTGIHV